MNIDNPEDLPQDPPDIEPKQNVSDLSARNQKDDPTINVAKTANLNAPNAPTDTGTQDTQAVADATATRAEPKPSPGTAANGVAKAADPDAPSDSHFYKYAGLYTFSVLVIATVVWLCYLPRRSDYPPSPERELCAQLAEAEKVANQGDTDRALPSGCQRPTQEHPVQKRVSFLRVAHSALAGSIQESRNDPTVFNRVEELQNDLTVWNRYEEEFSEFRYGKDLNWYMHSSLRMLVLVLSAITPALIVAPLFAKKKFLAALPAAIVAIGTACISEFDFKIEAASYGTALVEVLGEKTAFITRFNPTYNYLSAQSEQKSAAISQARGNSNKSAPLQQSDSTDGCTDGHVPFPKPEHYPEARANFACRIQQILQKRTGERDQFLRGAQSSSTPKPAKKQ